MIVSLEGTLTHWDAEGSVAWVEVGGVGYEVRIPVFAHSWVEGHELGQGLRLHTYYHASERQPVPLLIGFQHEQERQFFRKFIDVPDVGPIKAVRALTHPVSQIASWVEAEDSHALQQLPGIGLRLSQTIIANLQGRLVDLLGTDFEGDTTVTTAGALFEDAVAALEALQFPAREAERLVTDRLRRAPPVTELEELLRQILEEQAPA